MKYYTVQDNPHFVGRQYYWRRLEEIDTQPESAVIVVYGRRRIGKTELIEQFFRKKPILKFEGLQPDRTTIKKNDSAEAQRQIDACLARLDDYTESGYHFRRMRVKKWSEFFELLLPYVQDTPVVLYFEELQWLANYRDYFLSEFKPFWDDTLRHNPGLRVVISGSAPAFIVKQFLSNSAMYHRSNHMMKLEPFSPAEIASFMQKGATENLVAAISVGGIPEYLKQLKTAASVYMGLCSKSYAPDSFFRMEKDRIFVSSLSDSHTYEAILNYLAKHRYATRDTLYKAINRTKTKYAGGSFSAILQELIEVGFVEKYAPLTVKDPRTSRIARYGIGDEFLHFYFRCIEPKIADIDAGAFAEDLTSALNLHDFSKHMGLAFERWCRKNALLIAKQMKFAGVVWYKHGAWYARSSDKADGAQIDLMYIRKDSKIIVCEIKHSSEGVAMRKVSAQVQEKLHSFIEHNPQYRRYTLETALISAEPAPDAIRHGGYFDHWVDVGQLFIENDSLNGANVSR